MKRFAKNASLLLILFLLVDKPIGYLISKAVTAKQYDKRLQLLCEGQIQANTVILGSSRAINDLDAKAIGEAGGFTCYNLGFSGSNLTFHQSMLDIMLSSGLKPKRLLLTLDHGRTFKSGDQAIYRKDKLQVFARYPEVYRELCEHSNKIFWMGRLCWMYRENDNLFPALTYLKSGMDLPDITSNVDDHGSIILKGRSTKFEIIRESLSEQEYSTEGEKEDRLESFEAILNTCVQENIELYLVIPPALNLHFIGFRERLEELIAGRAVILDFSGIDNDEGHYYDNGHLNEKGTAVLAVKLAELL